MRALRLAVVGLGAAGARVANAIDLAGTSRVVAGVDTDARARRWFERRHSAPAYVSIADLRRSSDVDAVWVATPTVLHEEHTVAAAHLGLHVIVDKPMSHTMAGALRMIEECERNRVQLIAGGARSACATMREVRRLVAAGEVGALQAMSTIAATDWMLRPRRPDELDVEAGGGVVMRQAPHAVDSFRLIGGGRVRSVRGQVKQWMAGRGSAPGFLSALLQFEDGVVGTIVYSGYGDFMASELFEQSLLGPDMDDFARRSRSRREIQAGRDDGAEKADRLDAIRESAGDASQTRDPFLADVGLFVVHGDRGAIRQSRSGIWLYGRTSVSDVPVAPDGAEPYEVSELRSMLHDDVAPLHSGRWGLATLEVCLGIAESSRRGVDVDMFHQVDV